MFPTSQSGTTPVPLPGAFMPARSVLPPDLALTTPPGAGVQSLDVVASEARTAVRLGGLEGPLLAPYRNTTYMTLTWP
jgi:hypothetical protein